MQNARLTYKPLGNPCGAMAKRSSSSLQGERTQKRPETLVPSSIRRSLPHTFIHVHLVWVHVSSISHPSLVTSRPRFSRLAGCGMNFILCLTLVCFGSLTWQLATYFSQPGERFLRRGSFHPPRGLVLGFIHFLFGCFGLVFSGLCSIIHCPTAVPWPHFA